MSLILDALNRSREDVNSIPNLATQHPIEPVEQGNKHLLPWIALGVALLLIAWLVVERFTKPSVPAAEIGAPVAQLTENIGSAAASVTNELKARAAAQESAQQPQGAVGQSRMARIEPQAAKAEPPAREKAVRATVVDEARAAGIAGTESAEKTRAVVALAPPARRPATDNPAVARLYQNKDAVAATEAPARNTRSGEAAQAHSSSAGADTSAANQNEQPIDIKDVLQRAQEELEDASLEDHSAPFLSSLSQQSKDDIPTLYYQRHDYSADPSISSVVFNGKKVTVGGSPVPGLKVEEILTDSVILNYRGTQFRLRALNSWINL